VKILVTGAAGLLGRKVVHELLDRGHPVTATCRSASGDLGHESRLDGLERCELADPESVRILLARAHPEIVVHCAAYIGRAADRLLRDNVLATELLIAESARAECRGLVFCSSISVYDGIAPDRDGYHEAQALLPAGSYAKSKLIGEQALEIAASPSFRGVALRLAGLHGAPRTDGVVHHMLAAAEQGAPIRIDSPGTRFRLLFLADAVQALVLAVERELQADYSCYNVASRDVFDLATLATAVLRVTGSKSAVDIVGRPGGTDQVMNIEPVCRDMAYEPTGLERALAATWASMRSACLPA
jgi:nucleoside-diphosphate-sugar epimerase